MHVSKAIAEGVSNGTWVYHDPALGQARTHDRPPPQVRIASDVMLYTPEEAEKLGLLRKPVTLAAVRSALSRADRQASGTGSRVRPGSVLGGARLQSLLGDALGGRAARERGAERTGQPFSRCGDRGNGSIRSDRRRAFGSG